MPLIPPTSDRFAAVAATLHVSERLVGRWLASRTGCRGTIVSTSEGGRGQFHYTGAAQWWLQLRARSTLTVAGRPVGVRVTGHRTHDHLVVVDIATVDGSPLDAGGAGPAREEQDRLDVELGAYWTSRQLPGDVVGVGPNEGQDGQAATVTVDSAVIDAMPHPVYVTAADGCYVGANAAFAEAAGLPVGELVGRCPGEVWRERSPTGWNGGGPPVGDGGTDPIEDQVAAEVVWGDGSLRRIKVRQSTIALPGATPGVVGILVEDGDRAPTPDAGPPTTAGRPRPDQARLRAEADNVAILSSLLQAQLADTELQDQADALGAACERLRDAVDGLGADGDVRATGRTRPAG